MKRITLKKVLAEIIRRITVSTVSLFLWTSGIVGFFAGIADIVQYFRYSGAFPESDFTINLLAGLAAFLMPGSSVRAIVLLRGKRNHLWSSIVISSAMAFVLAFLPRPGIGSAVHPDLFIYMGGLGILALFLVSISDPPDTPDDAP